MNDSVAESSREWLVLLLLTIFLGFTGSHSFYAGKMRLGVWQLCTLGGLGVWVLLDLVVVLRNAYVDVDGLLIDKFAE